MKTQDLLMLGVAAGLGYVLYRTYGVAQKIGEKAVNLGAKIWLALDPLPPAIQLLGNVKFPGNLLVPLQTLASQKAVRQDRSSGDVYVQYSGYTWKLAPQQYGNWPATRID
jgi:hypothetical protein